MIAENRLVWYLIHPTVSIKSDVIGSVTRVQSVRSSLMFRRKERTDSIVRVREWAEGACNKTQAEDRMATIGEPKASLLQYDTRSMEVKKITHYLH
jgi:hypothetical protein